MLQRVHSTESQHRETSGEILTWWMSNALYLDPEPRTAFDKAWSAFLRHPMLLSPAVQAVATKVTENFDVLRALGPAIERAVSLPPIALDTKTKIEAAEPVAKGQDEGA